MITDIDRLKHDYKIPELCGNLVISGRLPADLCLSSIRKSIAQLDNSPLFTTAEKQSHTP